MMSMVQQQQPTIPRPDRPAMLEQRPHYIYQMKRQLVESVIDQQFAKFGSSDDVKSNDQSRDELADEDLETIIDVEGEKECSYIKKVLDEPVKDEQKKPTWSVADMLRKEPTKRQKARRKPQTPLCYREQQEELIRPYDDFHRVPYMPYMQTYMRDQAMDYTTHMRQNYMQNMQTNRFYGNETRRQQNIGSHQFSILGHRRMKSKPQRVQLQDSPLDVRNLLAEEGEMKKRRVEIEKEEPEVVVVDKSPSPPPPPPQPSPKPKYVPRFFQTLASRDVDKFANEKEMNMIRNLFAKVNNDDDKKTDTESDELEPEGSKTVEDECPESKPSESESSSGEDTAMKCESVDRSESSDQRMEFGGVIKSYIACVLDRGALDLSKATTSSSKLIHDKLNNVAYSCNCQPRRRVNPSRSSAKAGVLEPLPTACSPSPPPPAETSSHNKEHKTPSQFNHQFFLERTREINYSNFQPQLPTFIQPQQFMHNYDNLFKMAMPHFPIMPAANFQMNGPFIVPTIPPPKRGRIIPSIL